MMRGTLIDYNDLMSPLKEKIEECDLSYVLTEEKTRHPDFLLTWTDVLPIFKDAVSVANGYGIPTYLLQHGRRAMGDYLTGRAEPLAHHAFVWSDYDKKRALSGGWKQHEMTVIGCPLFVKRPKPSREDRLVVFNPVHWDCDIAENYDVWSLLRLMHGIRPVVKLIDDAHKTEMFSGEKVVTDRLSQNHLETTYALLARAACLITFLEDTLTLLAYSLDIPVIFLTTFKRRPFCGFWPKPEDVAPTEAVTTSDLQHLETNIHRVLLHPEMKQTERRKIMLREGGNPETITPYETILKTIESRRLK